LIDWKQHVLLIKFIRSCWRSWVDASWFFTRNSCCQLRIYEPARCAI